MTTPRPIEAVGRPPLNHGLHGHNVVLPDQTADAIADRMHDWRKDFRPDSPCQEWLFVHICTASIRVDSCLHHGIALNDEQALRARETWDIDRKLAAARLMAKLSRRPEIVQKQLLQFKQGCEALIATWKALEIGLDRQGAWTPSAWARALDLLGTPIESRTHREPTEADHREWIARQIEALKQLQAEVLDSRDVRERADAEAGLPADVDPSIRRVKLSESAALKRLQWAWKQLSTLQKASSHSSSPEPDSRPRPEPKARLHPSLVNDVPLNAEQQQFLDDFLKAHPPGRLQTIAEPADTLPKRPPAPAERRQSRRARRALARRA
ncbi:hypothetical protein BH23PLA1_BH23PLA1_30770 [soil metagenome]